LSARKQYSSEPYAGQGHEASLFAGRMRSAGLYSSLFAQFLRLVPRCLGRHNGLASQPAKYQIPHVIISTAPKTITATNFLSVASNPDKAPLNPALCIMFASYPDHQCSAEAVLNSFRDLTRWHRPNCPKLERPGPSFVGHRILVPPGQRSTEGDFVSDCIGSVGSIGVGLRRSVRPNTRGARLDQVPRYLRRSSDF
jgi:hypothetical protein